MVRANAGREGERGPRGRAPGASTQTQNDLRELVGKLKPFNGQAIPGAIESLRQKSVASIDAMKSETTGSIDRMNLSVGTSVDRTTAKVGTEGAITRNTVRYAEALSASRIVAATAAQTGAIVGAIFAARPVVNVTNVTRSTTIQQRYGPISGSAGSDALHNAGGH
jgi:hypothetical protein